jgi:N-methylhydantoinase B
VSVDRGVDPITLAVVHGATRSIVREMTAIIQRTARSPILALGNDFSNAVYTTAGGAPEMVVQGQDQPVHLGGMIVAVKSVASMWVEEVRPGDIFVRNEPSRGGSHLIDIDVIAPVWSDGRLVAWACSRAHMGDIGGPAPGGYNPHAEDLFSEGLIMPPTKLVEGGRTREDVWRLILANVRIPELVAGDIGAQLSAVRVATRRLEQLFERYGTDTVDRAMAQILDRAEELARADIGRIPDGEFTGESWIEDDGHGTGDLCIRTVVRKHDDRLDVTIESPPACRSYRNSYAGATLGAVYFAIITGLEPGLPINEGLYRAVEVDLGEPGTMLNARLPAACAMSTGDVWAAVWESVCDALSKMVPERACAGWSQLAVNTLAGIDPRDGQPYSTGPLHITHQGGSGAVTGVDGGGLWGLICTGGAASVGDVELLEFRLPLHFHQHELWPDSGVPGTWRGAPGAMLDVEIVGHEATVTHIGTGTVYPPPSRLGGGSPEDVKKRIHRKVLVRADGTREELGLHAIVTAGPGDRIVAQIPGGGAVGPAERRDPELVVRDLRAGLVSPESARDEYGLARVPPTRPGAERVRHQMQTQP